MEEASPYEKTEGSEDGYYVSITDMLVGLLFLFILLLMYFALQLRNTTQDLVTAEQTRSELLQKVATYLQDRHIQAAVDLQAGVLRLPDEILFEKGRDQPKQEGEAALGVLASALATHLPCYSFQPNPPPPGACKATPHHLEAIFIEGHTDIDPVTPTARIRDNWDLSAARASNTWRILLTDQVSLALFSSAPPGLPESKPIFSVAGYADQRPVARGGDEAAKAANRRIDVRFVMASPDIKK